VETGRAVLEDAEPASHHKEDHKDCIVGAELIEDLHTAIHDLNVVQTRG
jgi:hypothetical protein